MRHKNVFIDKLAVSVEDLYEQCSNKSFWYSFILEIIFTLILFYLKINLDPFDLNNK